MGMEIGNFNLNYHKSGHSGEAGERALPVDSATVSAPFSLVRCTRRGIRPKLS